MMRRVVYLVGENYVYVCPAGYGMDITESPDSMVEIVVLESVPVDIREKIIDLFKTEAAIFARVERPGEFISNMRKPRERVQEKSKMMRRVVYVAGENYVAECAPDYDMYKTEKPNSILDIAVLEAVPVDIREKILGLFKADAAIFARVERPGEFVTNMIVNMSRHREPVPDMNIHGGSVASTSIAEDSVAKFIENMGRLGEIVANINRVGESGARPEESVEDISKWRFWSLVVAGAFFLGAVLTHAINLQQEVPIALLIISVFFYVSHDPVKRSGALLVVATALVGAFHLFQNLAPPAGSPSERRFTQ